MRKWFLDVIFTHVMDDGGGYWKRIFQDKEKWDPRDAAGLIFALTAEPGSLIIGKDGRIEGGNVVPVSQIPAPWIFWECVLTALMLFHPECWPNPRALVDCIYERIGNWHYACPQQFLNFSGAHLQKLDELRDGRRELTFAEKPLTNTILLECHKIPMIRAPTEVPPIPRTGSISVMATYFRTRGEIKQLRESLDRSMEEVADRFATMWEQWNGPIEMPVLV